MVNNQVGFVASSGTGLLSGTIGVGSSSFICSRKGGVGPRSIRARGASRTLERWNVERKSGVFAIAVPVEVNEDTFEAEVLQADMPVLVDFYAPWCGPCKLVAPLMDWAASAFEGKLKVVKIDTAINESFVTKYQVYGLPTFAVFVDGEAKGLQEGAMSKSVLTEYIKKHSGASVS